MRAVLLLIRNYNNYYIEIFTYTATDLTICYIFISSCQDESFAGCLQISTAVYMPCLSPMWSQKPYAGWSLLSLSKGPYIYPSDLYLSAHSIFQLSRSKWYSWSKNEDFHLFKQLTPHCQLGVSFPEKPQLPQSPPL